MLEISILSAFVGGLLTFLATCTLPLIPAFLAFVGGDSGRRREDTKERRRSIFVNALCFVAGFLVVFMLFGLASGAFGEFLITNKKLLSQVGGVFIIILGLGMLGVFAFPRFSFLARTKLPTWVHGGTRRGGFLFGLLFGLGWSPCLGPILGTILILAGTSGSALSGAGLLFVYGLGLGIPFLVVAFLYGTTISYVVALEQYLPIISRIGAVIIIAIGTLLLVGQFGIIASFGIDIYNIPSLKNLVESM